MRYLVIFFLVLSSFVAEAQTSRKTALAFRTDVAPVIDGKIDELLWQKVEPVTAFRQYLPLHDTPASFPTEVKIAYDDQAIYISALLYDPYPDSIPMQLGNRDDEHLNVDYFGVEFDTYKNQLDAFTFIVTTAGVQIDSRESDETYDAVWMSETRRVPNGWTAEMKIPYSALRFPSVQEQVWGMQITRYIRRYRETIQWSLEKQGADNDLVYWGELRSIENIEPPVRLSITPYLATAIEHYPNPDSKDISTSFGGGMDLKYGLNESYTLDMTLLPDFSQVQSDNKIKNLSAFETIYSEQRPFFKEAVDLFDKGDIFYSRRIGRTPEHFTNVNNLLDSAETLIKNPVRQQLINATKLSGRGNKGLAFGILNAVTANTYAIAEGSSGNQRKILTDPASNYNMLVLAQALKNNSEIFISNSNLTRARGYSDANVTAAGIKLNDKTNTYVVNINGGVSQNWSSTFASNSERTVDVGYKLYAGIGKTSGAFQFTLVKGAMNAAYDANAMGITHYNNYHTNYLNLSYNVYQPWWLLRELHSNLTLQNENHYTTGKVQKAAIYFRTFGTTMEYLTLWLNTGHSFLETYDYYEPRVTGMFFLAPRYLTANMGFSSDYRRKFALDGLVTLASAPRDGTREFGFSLHPIVRVNNHFLFQYTFLYNKVDDQIGFTAIEKEDKDLSIFGKRDVSTLVNTVEGKYLFMNNLSLNLNIRHYWAKGKYKQFFLLKDDGRLSSYVSYEGDDGYNYNAFTVDMVFTWIFLPGSSLNLVWKNAINPPEDKYPVNNYFTNLRNTLDSPQQNVLSLKVLYYLDYQQIKHKFK